MSQSVHTKRKVRKAIEERKTWAGDLKLSGLVHLPEVEADLGRHAAEAVDGQIVDVRERVVLHGKRQKGHQCHQRGAGH